MSRVRFAHPRSILSLTMDGRRALALLLVVIAAATGCKPEISARGQPSESASSSPFGSATKSRDRNNQPGNGAAVIEDNFQLGPDERTALLRLARASMESYVKQRVIPDAPEELLKKFPQLGAARACFVTLRKAGDLRGCIGSLEARRPLVEDVRQNAVAAAVSDSRFSPVSIDELAHIDVEISVLDQPKLLQGVSVQELPAWLSKHKPGLIIEYRGRRSTFLPSVWEELPDPNDFLDRLCRKQGSAPGCWRDPAAQLSVYGSIHFGEKDTH
jgi:AmmeMemoRadiSam system protein A